MFLSLSIVGASLHVRGGGHMGDRGGASLASTMFKALFSKPEKYSLKHLQCVLVVGSLNVAGCCARAVVVARFKSSCCSCGVGGGCLAAPCPLTARPTDSWRLPHCACYLVLCCFEALLCALLRGTAVVVLAWDDGVDFAESRSVTVRRSPAPADVATSHGVDVSAASMQRVAQCGVAVARGCSIGSRERRLLTALCVCVRA